MDNLRLILLLLGVAVIAAIWAFEVWRRRRNAALREDPFADAVADDYDIDELPPWDEDDFPGDEAETVPGAVAQRPRQKRAAAPERPAPRPRDLFDDEPQDQPQEDDEPPLGDLPPMHARRDEGVAEAAPELPAIVPEAPTTPHATQPPARPAAPRPVGDDAEPGTTPSAEDDAEPAVAPARRQPEPAGPTPRAPSQEPGATAGRTRVAATPAEVDGAARDGHGAGEPQDGDRHDEQAPRAAAPPHRPPPPSRPERVLSLTVMARPGRRFVGHQIRAALESVGMRYGDMDIFHLHAESEDDAPVETLFAAVNVLKPGTFDLSTLGQLATPGVALFMQVPGPADPQQTFERMLDTARRLAERLGGEVGDAARQPLTAASLAAMRAVAAGEDEGPR